MINDYIALELRGLDGNPVYIIDNKFLIMYGTKDIDDSPCCYINSIYVDHTVNEVWEMIKYEKSLQEKSKSMFVKNAKAKKPLEDLHSKWDKKRFTKDRIDNGSNGR